MTCPPSPDDVRHQVPRAVVHAATAPPPTTRVTYSSSPFFRRVPFLQLRGVTSSTTGISTCRGVVHPPSLSYPFSCLGFEAQRQSPLKYRAASVVDAWEGEAGCQYTFGTRVCSRQQASVGDVRCVGLEMN